MSRLEEKNLATPVRRSKKRSVTDSGMRQDEEDIDRDNPFLAQLDERLGKVTSGDKVNAWLAGNLNHEQLEGPTEAGSEA